MLRPFTRIHCRTFFLPILTVILLIHHPTNVQAAGSIEGHGRFEKITDNPSMGYKELYEWDLYLCPSDNSWAGVSRRLGAPPGQVPTGDGFYRIDNVPAGTYSILVNQPNFFASPKVVTNVQIVDNQTTYQDVLLDVDYSTYFRDGGQWTAWDWTHYQTFKAIGTSVRGVSWVMAGAGEYSGDWAEVSILEDNGDADVRNWTNLKTKTLGSLGADTDLWVRWFSNELKLTPDKMYAVKIWVNGGCAIYKRDKDANSYDFGQSIDQNGNPRNLDLCITVFTDQNDQIVSHTQLDPHIGNETNDENLWGQTFTATGAALAAANVYAHSGAADFTLTWKILRGGPGGAQVGPTKTIWGTYYGAAVDLIGVSYNPTEVSLTPGQTYYIEFSNYTHTFNPRKHKDGNAYSDGAAYRNGTVQTYDLNLTIMQYDTEPPESPDLKGLRGYWPLDEKSGDTAADSSPIHHDGTRIGNAAWTPGKVAGGLSLDGQGDYIDLGNSSGLKSPLPITMAAWIKLDQTGKNQALINIDKKNDDDSQRYYGAQILVLHTGKLSVLFGDGQPDSYQLLLGDTVLLPDIWYHVAAVIRGPEDMSLYINGQDDGGTIVGTGGDIAYSDGTSEIGCRSGSILFFDGCIDDVVLFDVALTPTDIHRLYKLSGQAFLPPCGDVLLPPQAILPGDINRNCVVDLNDYLWLAQEWLHTGPSLLTDIYEDIHDRVDHSDLHLMLSDWLTEIDPTFIGHWTLDDGAGSIAQDRSYNENHGQLQGDATWSAGHLGGALSLDGDGDYVHLGGSPALKPNLPLTIATWIKLDQTGIFQAIINTDKKDYDAEHRIYGAQLLVWNTGELSVSFGDGKPNSSYRLLNGTTALQPGTWYHVAAVIRGPEDMKLYLNGQDDVGVIVGAGGDIAYADGSSEIGSRSGTALFFHGAIDDLRIYHRALNEQEIISLAGN